MASNSIRIGAELFEVARAEGVLMSRSAAQQVEHWARIGAALESCGLTVGQVAALLKASSADRRVGDADLWAFKRARQQADMDSGQAGRLTQDQLSWFSGGKTRNLKVIGLPY